MESNDSTSHSLLMRATANDQDSWRQLVGLYAPLVTHWCRQAGIPSAELDDFAQEIFAAVAEGLKSRGARDPQTSFRGWMRGIARHKIHDYFRRHAPRAEGGTDAMVRFHAVASPIPPPELSEGPPELSGLYRRALDSVRVHFEANTWQAFWKLVIDEVPPADVASELGMSKLSVRQAKSRVLRRLRTELGELIE